MEGWTLVDVRRVYLQRALVSQSKWFSLQKICHDIAHDRLGKLFNAIDKAFKGTIKAWCDSNGEMPVCFRTRQSAKYGINSSIDYYCMQRRKLTDNENDESDMSSTPAQMWVCRNSKRCSGKNHTFSLVENSV